MNKIKNFNKNKPLSIDSFFYFIASILIFLSYSNYYNNDVKCSVHFTPYENCTQYIVNQINNARDEILVQTYSFTSKEITNALINKHKNNVKIIIIADNSQKNNIALIKFKNLGIPVYIDKLPGIAHNKVMIIDEKVVLTGSFNFTESAQHRNAENSLIISSYELAKKYKENFYKRFEKSKPIEKII